MVTRCLLREAAPAPLLRWCALSKNATSHHSHTESGSISLHALSAPAWRGVRELLEAPGCRVGFYWGKKPEELKQSKTKTNRVGVEPAWSSLSRGWLPAAQ